LFLHYVGEGVGPCYIQADWIQKCCVYKLIVKSNCVELCKLLGLSKVALDVDVILYHGLCFNVFLFELNIAIFLARV
jgi:hypothetical protein